MAGSLPLDDLPVRVRDPESGRHRIAFRLFCAMGYEAGRPKLWRLEAFTSKSQADWEAPWAVSRRGSGATTTLALRRWFVLASLTLSCTYAQGTGAMRWSG
jgi:hypothetical protein